jgi:hypothetical protein
MFFRGHSMKLISRAIMAATVSLFAMAPVMAQQKPPVRTGTSVPIAPIGGMLPDLIVLRFIGGRTLDVPNPSRAAGGQPHEVVAAQKGIPQQCQAWKEGPSRQGYGFVAEITQMCGN